MCICMCMCICICICMCMSCACAAALTHANRGRQREGRQRGATTFGEVEAPLDRDDHPNEGRLSPTMLLALASASLMLRPPPTALPTPTLSPAHAEALRLTTVEHAAAVSKQQEAWALDYEPLPHFFMEDDFEVATRVQANYAGPDAASLHEGGVVHETTVPVLASHECQRLVAEVESMLGTRAANPATYGEGQGDTLYSVPEVERRVVHLHAMQAFGSSWLQQKLRSHFFPMVANRYGLDPDPITVTP